MSRIKNRLRSRQGASITFALLLFLVCAVLSSVIIVATTTAAGRMAGMAKTDQRYYAVTSASELLKELISEKTVTVAKVTKSTTSEKTYIDGTIQDSSVPVTTDPNYPIYYVVNGSADGMSAEALSNLPDAKTNPSSFNKLSTIIEDAGYRYYTTTPTSSFPLTSSFALSSTGEANDPLAVNISEIIQADGSLVLTLSTPANTFQQQLVFSCSVNDTSSLTSYDEVTESSVTDNRLQSKVKTHTTEVVARKMTWTLAGVNSIGGGS